MSWAECYWRGGYWCRTCLLYALYWSGWVHDSYIHSKLCADISFCLFWDEFSHACRMHRQPEHVMNFLLAEMGTSGSLDGQQRLVVKGRFAPKNFEGILRRYISKFKIFFLQKRDCFDCFKSFLINWEFVYFVCLFGSCYALFSTVVFFSHMTAYLSDP